MHGADRCAMGHCALNQGASCCGSGQSTYPQLYLYVVDIALISYNKSAIEPVLNSNNQRTIWCCTTHLHVQEFVSYHSHNLGSSYKIFVIDLR